MKITIVAKLNAAYQVEHQCALEKGFSDLGWGVTKTHNGLNCNSKYVACWGWKLGQMLRSRGHEVLVMERGYLGDRFKYSSLAWNGLNGYGDFGEIGEVTSERFDQVAKLKAWKETGSYILILGQVPGDQSLKGANLHLWYEKMALHCASVYKVPVLFRPHPEAIRKNKHKVVRTCENVIDGSLEEVLSDALFTVTFNSNSSVDSILNGVPCYVEDAGSMANEVSSKSINNIVRPERESWAYKLAHKQWTLEEMKSGVALKNLIAKI